MTGTNYTGTSGSYPITFNNPNTYGTITNFTSANFNNNVTLYIKVKGTGVQLGVQICFQGAGGFMTIALANATKGAFLYYQPGIMGNSTQRYITPGNTNATNPDINTNSNNFFHTFVKFNISSKTVTTIMYSVNGTLRYTSPDYVYPSGWVSFNSFSLAKPAPDISVSGYSTIQFAGWYNDLLTSVQMQTIVTNNLSPAT
jgi:hypothetical protein